MSPNASTRWAPAFPASAPPPCALTVWIALAAPGLRSSARAQAKTVSFSPRSSNSRSTRQKPTRLPYSNIDSAARSRSPCGTGGVPTSVVWVVCGYLGINVLYSVRLKHVVLLDVFIIALGFLLRVTSGALAIEVGISPWLIICTFFIALFLAFCKRRHELESLGEDAAAHRGILARYSTPFIDKMIGALASMTTGSEPKRVGP